MSLLLTREKGFMCYGLWSLGSWDCDFCTDVQQYISKMFNVGLFAVHRLD